MKIDNKVVPSYVVASAGERCHIHLLDLCMGKNPKEALNNDVFYLHPLDKVPSSVD